MEAQTLTWNAALKYAAVVLAPLLALLGGTVLWSRSLQKQVRQRTKSLSDALEALRQNQQQLVQADKMAALGVLVSGVAHARRAFRQAIDARDLLHIHFFGHLAHESFRPRF